jgi:hypothetical protein
MLACKYSEVEVELVPAVEPLVEEPEHPLCRRQVEPQVELEVEMLEVAEGIGDPSMSGLSVVVGFSPGVQAARGSHRRRVSR